MESGPLSCAFCTKSFPSTDKWIPHYNSQHSTEYRAQVPFRYSGFKVDSWKFAS